MVNADGDLRAGCHRWLPPRRRVGRGFWGDPSGYRSSLGGSKDLAECSSKDNWPDKLAAGGAAREPRGSKSGPQLAGLQVSTGVRNRQMSAAPHMTLG